MINPQADAVDGINLERLLKLRLLVARFGEMDQARWWNTRGVLGRFGEMALKRGFPKTRVFAQSRLVFAVAAHRCREVFDPPQSMTLWNLPAEIEDRFESQWADWVDRTDAWSSFFAELQVPKSTDLLEEASRLGLADDNMLREVRQLRRSAEKRTVPIPGEHRPSNQVLSLLGLGFFRGEPGRPRSPTRGWEAECHAPSSVDGDLDVHDRQGVADPGDVCVVPRLGL